jgi:hypothetical protein
MISLEYYWYIQPVIGYVLVKSQDPKGQMKFECTADIPAITGDDLAYDVACLHFFPLV